MAIDDTCSPPQNLHCSRRLSSGRLKPGFWAESSFALYLFKVINKPIYSDLRCLTDFISEVAERSVSWRQLRSLRGFVYGRVILSKNMVYPLKRSYVAKNYCSHPFLLCFLLRQKLAHESVWFDSNRHAI